MEGAQKIENENTLRVASVNEKLLAASYTQPEVASQEVITLPPLKNKSVLEEEIKAIKHKIIFLQNYNEHEEHFYPKDKPFMPLIKQLRYREQELEELKKQKNSWFS